VDRGTPSRRAARTGKPATSASRSALNRRRGRPNAFPEPSRGRDRYRVSIQCATVIISQHVHEAHVRQSPIAKRRKRRGRKRDQERPQAVICQSADELLKLLDPSSALWRPFEYGRWAFRGQADAEWDLVPRAFRPGERLSFKDASLVGPLEPRKQVEAEAQLLSEFVELADELGSCQVISRSSGTRGRALPIQSFQMTHRGHRQKSWRPSRLRSTTTFRRVCLTSRSIRLWAPTSQRRIQKRNPAPLPSGRLMSSSSAGAWAIFEPGVRVVQVSRGSNPFLHAQSGLFIYDAAASSPSLRKRIMDHDVTTLSHIDQPIKDNLAKSPRVRCIRLASSHRLRLLELLAWRRVTEAHLQPTLHNVVSQLRGR